MKKLIPFTFLAMIFVISSCALKEVIGPNGVISASSSSSGSGTGTGGSTATGTGTSGKPSATSYLPLTKGTTWKYLTSGIFGDTLTYSMTDTVVTVNNKGYLKFNITTAGGYSSQSGYYFYSNNLYLLRSDISASAAFEDIPVLKDNAAVSGTWITTTNPGGGGSGQFKGTMMEKNISRVVNGKTYANVYHTQVEQQYGYAGVFTTLYTYQYYFAPGVGMIEYSKIINGAGTTTPFTQTLLSAVVK